MSTVKKWTTEFKYDYIFFDDDSHEGRPKIATTPETIQKAHDIVFNDRRVRVSELAVVVGISKEKVRNIKNK